MTITLTAEENYLFQKLREKRLNQAEVLTDFSMKGLARGTSDIYPDPAHFVYELLQNADDAEATCATFYLNGDALIFKHNGTIHFTITEDKEDVIPYGHINSITAYHSSKGVETNKIGKFGLGFKSVYSYTTRPEIYDDKFKFYIEKRMVPTLINHDHPLRKQGETLFVLPLNDSKTSVLEISRKLRSLSSPTLFLRHLKNVYYFDEINGNQYRCEKQVLSSSGDNYFYKRNLLLDSDPSNIICDYIALEDMGKKSKLLLFRRMLSLEEYGDQEISVGYYLNEDGSLDVNTKRGIYCFFPTKESFNLCFISHAPFLLTNNRQNLNESKLNRHLVEELARLAADALPFLRDFGRSRNIPLLTDNLFSIIPSEYYFNKKSVWWEKDDYTVVNQKYFLDAYKEVIKKDNLLYTISGNYIFLYNAYFLSTSDLRGVLGDEEIKILTNNENAEILQIDDDKKLREFLSDCLGISQYTPEKLAQDITGDFMEGQGEKWVLRFYRYLAEDARSTWNRIEKRNENPPMRYAPIIKNQNNEWVAPYRKQRNAAGGTEELLNVFIPMGDSISGYNFINSTYYNREVDEKILSLFRDMGIKEPDAFDFVTTQILPKYSQKEIDKESLRKDLYTLMQICSDDDNENKEMILKEIKDKITLFGSNGMCNRPTTMYSPVKSLKTYFDQKEEVVFVDLDFYYDKNKYVEKEDIRAFLEKIGVNVQPRIILVQKQRYELNIRQLSAIDTTRTTNLNIIDYELDGLSFMLDNNLTKENSLLVWNTLSWINMSEYEDGTYTYSYYGYKTIHFKSSFICLLLDKKWLFDENDNLCSVDEMSQEDVILSGYARNEKLFELFGIRKRGKTIKELGGTEEQQRQQELGEEIERMGLTLEQIKEMLEEKAKQQALQQSSSDNRQDRPATSTSYGSFDDGKESNSLDDMFDTRVALTIPERPGGSDNLPSRKNKDIEQLKQKLEEDGNKQIEREQLRQEADELPKYTKEWFLTRLKLEYLATSDSEKTTEIRKSISISFSRIVLDKDNNRLYELRNPSRDIPVWIEEIENLTVDFLFNDREELSCSFEVANVRDYSLRLKAKAADAEDLASVDWTKFTKATINTNNPIDLVNNFRKAFKNLMLPDGYNLQEHLRENISFVFGPPGTGKTTHLANEIIKYMSSKRNTWRILVLAPTNKACDVLVKKIMELDDSYSWLGRFVTTGDPEIEDMGVVCDRDSDIYKDNKCCVVSTMARLPYDWFKDVDGYHYLKDIDWDLIICDEASMIPIAQITYAIYQFKKTPFVIAGDPLQITPIDVTNIWNGESIYDMVNLKSFEKPETLPRQFKIHNLETQYRSIPAIGGLFSDYAYNGRLQHYWSKEDQLPLNIPGLDLKAVNYIPFRVENYDSMFSAKRLANSNIHIYSALLSTEFCRYLAKRYVENNPDEERLDIGIICPYASQAQLIQKMLEQMTDLPSTESVNITTGTIHSFQGDQCNIVIAVFNPPVGLKYEKAAIMSHLNNRNIINVAISRAKDYLCIMLPDKESCLGYENLKEIIKLGTISTTKYHDDTALITSSMIEEITFGTKGFLKDNTFVTSHQLANVYTKAMGLYEIRVDENSVDIQFGDN